MLFPTVEFAVFFLAVLAASWALHRHLLLHKLFLLSASYLFYAFWNWRYCPLLLLISVISALVAQRIERGKSPASRKGWLVAGVILCLLPLVYYKYLTFLFVSVFSIWAHFRQPPAVTLPMPFLPLGISFFVFHAISLMGDAYRGKLRERVHLLDCLLYVAFFPQLIAGPILRAAQFLPQLARKRDPNAIRVNRAMLLIVAGLFKKVILSNILATRLVEPVFSAPQTFSGLDTLLAIYGYAAQIYCDFSGYTDIAIGCAMLLGYRFTRNFNAPYTAANPQEFWERWHISLSSWLRDYLYIPMGGSRRGSGRTYLNLMITMLLGGLWHGASWTFVIWGALHGFYLIVHRLWKPSTALEGLRETAAWTWIARLLLFHAVCIGWVFFRAPSFELAFTVFHRLGASGAATLATFPVVLALTLGIFGQYQPRRWRRTLEFEAGRWPVLVRGAALALAIFAIEVFGPTGVAPFIYFQF